MCVCVREREKKRERKREKERERDRQTERKGERESQQQSPDIAHVHIQKKLICTTTLVLALEL